MATYKEIKGVTVQTLDSDPVENVGSWAAGADLNTARSENTGVGILTAALSIGGNTSPGATAVVEQYNGTAWTETGDLNTARRNTGGGGTYTSSIVAGGDTPGADEVNNVETWDGSSWTETTDLNTARKRLKGAGASSTATVVFGGQIPPNSPSSATSTAITELWNGSSWTEVNNLNTARYGSASFGISTAAIMAGGQHNPPPSQSAATEQWDGSSWTEIADISVRTFLSGAGTTTSGLVFGGSDPAGPGTTKTESWDGSSWTTVNSLATAFQKGAGCGASNTSALQFGGRDAPDSNYIATTQEWEFPPVTAATLTEGDLFLSGGTTLKGFGKAAGVPSATWASGGALNQPGRGPVCATAGVSVSSGQIAGGTPNLANTEQYNGTSWTEVNDLNEGRSAVAGTGKLTSALAAGGDSPPGTNVNSTELWDGTNWTETANLNTARRNSAASGDSTTSSLYFGGYTTTYVANTESWDGSSWTEVSDLNSARGYIGGSGSQTSAIAISGEPSPRNYVETWDGSSWTEVTEINTARAQGGSSSFGSKSFALYFGGEPPASTANTEFWNGSSWTEVNDLSTGRSNLDGSGSAASALAVSGGPPTPQTVLTEEFDAPATLSTVTVS